MPTNEQQPDPKEDVRPGTDAESPAAPRTGAGERDDGATPLLPFGEDPGTIGVDDPTAE